MRIGAKKRPFYRVVAIDERKKRTGAYLELLGTYNPLTEPKEIILKQDRIDWWMGHGAVPSYGYLRIIKQAPQRAPRKPKKAAEEKQENTPASQPKAAEAEEVKEAPEVITTEAVTSTPEEAVTETVTETAQAEEDSSEKENKEE